MLLPPPPPYSHTNPCPFPSKKHGPLASEPPSQEEESWPRAFKDQTSVPGYAASEDPPIPTTWLRNFVLFMVQEFVTPRPKTSGPLMPTPHHHLGTKSKSRQHSVLEELGPADWRGILCNLLVELERFSELSMALQQRAMPPPPPPAPHTQF